MNAKKSDKNEAAGLEDEAGCPSQSWTGVRGYCSCHMDLCSRDSRPALTGNQSEKYTTSLSLLLARHMREKLYFHINKYLKVILFIVCLWFIGDRGAFVLFYFDLFLKKSNWTNWTRLKLREDGTRSFRFPVGRAETRPCFRARFSQLCWVFFWQDLELKI